jgi:adenylate cyclase
LNPAAERRQGAGAMNQRIVRIALGLGILAVFLGHAGKFYAIGIVTRLDHVMYDTRLRLTAPGTVDDRIVILDIDERSLATPGLGRWPWSRDVTAALVRKLFDKYGVALVAFDVVNGEPDRSSGLPVLERLAAGELSDAREFQDALERLRPRLDNDGLFAQTLKARPVVLGFYFTNPEQETSGVLPAPVLDASIFRGRNIEFARYRGYGANLAQFQTAALGAGHFTPLIDEDGIIRRVPLLAEYKGEFYEPLSLAVFRALAGVPRVGAGFAPESRFLSRDYGGLEWLEVGSRRIPIDANAAALIPFRGKRGSFPYVSFADLYHDKVPVEQLKGRVVLVGASAPGLVDLRATPVGTAYPGVEIHANLIAGMLDGSIKQRPAYVIGAEVLLLAAFGTALALALPLLSPLRATLAVLGALALAVALNLAVWTHADTALPLASGVLMIIALFALNMSYGYFVETRSKRQFTELFGQYVPPELVDEMARDPAKYNMEGKNEVLTVLFTDVRGFTSIAEGLDPRALAAFLNEFLTAMSLVIRTHRGTLDKYMGDAIMAFWGAPVADPEHARHALEAALAMHAELARLNPTFRARGWPEIRIGVGLNTGPMSVGDMGSKLRKAYTVMGDAVNLASRLEGLTKAYGAGIIVGQATRDAVPGFVFRELDRVRVKGKDAPVAIFEPVGPEKALAKERLEELKLWGQALKAYRARNWDQAELILFNLHRLYPGAPLYSLYAERAARYRRESPGAGWDGVTAFETK